MAYGEANVAAFAGDVDRGEMQVNVGEANEKRSYVAAGR